MGRRRTHAVFKRDVNHLDRVQVGDTLIFSYPVIFKTDNETVSNNSDM